MNRKTDLCVVIATFNSAATLAKCLDSIVNQSVQPQLIIIDGGSSDKTVEIIKAYERYIYFWISEPDTGVYDAWNKAIKKSSADWIMFLGSDDRLLTEVNVLIDYLDKLGGEVDLVYGKINRDYDGRIVESDENKEISSNIYRTAHHMPFTHVGSVHRAKSFKEFGLFDPTFRIVGDFDFYCRIRKARSINYFSGHKLSMGMGGLSQSSQSRIRLLCEQLIVMKRNRLYRSWIYVYLKYSYYRFRKFLVR